MRARIKPFMVTVELKLPAVGRAFSADVWPLGLSARFKRGEHELLHCGNHLHCPLIHYDHLRGRFRCCAACVEARNFCEARRIPMKSPKASHGCELNPTIARAGVRLT